MTASPSNRYRLDDLRRLATGLASSLGVPPPRASALAGHLLWFDAAGASTHGIATLPNWLDRIEQHRVDPLATGRASLERAGTAVFDAQRGIGPLTLETAAGIASEKARDVGIGIVRVRNIGETGPAAPVAAAMAIGPFVAVIAGPAPSLTIAMPTVEGLPAIYDSVLAGSAGGKPVAPPEGWSNALTPWLSTLAGGDGWLILALSVAAMESLPTFHHRVASLPRGVTDPPGQLWPETLARSRLMADQQGVPLDELTFLALKQWAGRCDVPWPKECGV